MSGGVRVPWGCPLVAALGPPVGTLTALASHGAETRWYRWQTVKVEKIGGMSVRDKRERPSNRMHAALMYVAFETPLRMAVT